MIVRREVVAQVEPDVAFAYLSDFTTTTEWDPGTGGPRRAAGARGVGPVDL